MGQLRCLAGHRVTVVDTPTLFLPAMTAVRMESMNDLGPCAAGRRRVPRRTRPPGCADPDRRLGTALGVRIVAFERFHTSELDRGWTARQPGRDGAREPIHG